MRGRVWEEVLGEEGGEKEEEEKVEATLAEPQPTRMGSGER